MTMNPGTVYNIISVVVIPLIVGVARKFKLPVKYAPVFAFGVATILVGLSKAIGIDLQINSIADALLTALMTAGVAVLGYDQVKKITEVK